MSLSIESVLRSLPPASDPAEFEHAVRRLVKTREEAGYTSEQALAGVAGLLRRIAIEWGLEIPEVDDSFE